LLIGSHGHGANSCPTEPQDYAAIMLKIRGDAPKRLNPDPVLALRSEIFGSSQLSKKTNTAETPLCQKKEDILDQLCDQSYLKMTNPQVLKPFIKVIQMMVLACCDLPHEFCPILYSQKSVRQGAPIYLSMLTFYAAFCVLKTKYYLECSSMLHEEIVDAQPESL